MNICPNCKNKENNTVCSSCGTKTRSTTATKVGVAVRLSLFGLMVAASAIGTVLAIPELMSEGFFKGLMYLPLVSGLFVGVAVLIMLLIKWGIFVFPKSFKIANSLASHLVAFSIYGLALKLMIWVSAILFPFGIGCSICSSLLMGIASLLMAG